MQRRIDMQKMLFAVAMTLSSVTAHAQLDPPGPFHLARLHGVYVNAKGDPIQGAQVTLQQNDKVVYATKTDAAGRFAFRHVSGHFWLHVNAKGYAQLDREVIVGLEALTYLRTDTLYVIAGPGACSDDCCTVFRSRSKFDEAIRRNKEHQY
jgi:hypothetical protein